MTIQTAALTQRQQNELDYHRAHAQDNAYLLEQKFSFDVIEHPGERWWNAYWEMFAWFSQQNLTQKRVLVVGCGFGDDALRLAKLGAEVWAFDLSPDSLAIAKQLAQREGLTIQFEQMPAEAMHYPTGFFDYILARDILHHVDIAQTMREIERVAKPDACFVVNEIYSHSITDWIRHNWLVEKVLYPRMQSLVYGEKKPYITQDERKLTEQDLKHIRAPLSNIRFTRYFNFVVTRLVSDKRIALAKLDQTILKHVGKTLGGLVSGRVFFVGSIAKSKA